MTHSEISSETEQPFARDRLDRKKAAEFLTEYLIGRHRVAGSVPGNESFVLNVNAEWGLGKTYFLTEWAKMLRSAGHPVVYFDAWENDYASNPFVGFMAEIERQLTKGLDRKQKVTQLAKTVISKGARVIKASAPTVALSVVKNFTGLDGKELLETAKNATPDIVSAVKRDLEKENKDLRNAIQAFKEAFATFASIAQEEKSFTLPVFLMVDELDRCRPSYAIELLEHIKHIFRIPNVYTIVATDSQQLAHSIKAIYGAEFDSRKYLRRFFDHESRLDNPSFESLAKAALETRNMVADKNLLNVFSALGITSADALSKIANALRVTTRDFQRSIEIIDSIRITSPGPKDLVLLAFMTMLYVSHGDLFDKYQQDPRRNTMSKLLLERGEMRVTFREMTDSPSGRNKTDVPVLEWLMRYLNGIWAKDQNSFQDSYLTINYAINNSTLQDINKLRRYHDLVSMVAHFSM